MPQVVVVGGGVMGSATAWALARRGASVALLERFEIGHARGSSHGRSRIFRFSYPQQWSVRMAQESLPLWRRLEADTGRAILRTTGGLDAGEGLGGNRVALQACGAGCELLDVDEARRRFPLLHPPTDVPLLYSPDSGVIAADVAWSSLVSEAESHGCIVREGVEVLSIGSGSGVRVETTGGTVTADVAVVTAGPWARGLLARSGIALDVRETRETIAYFKTAEEEAFTYVEWTDPPAYALPSEGQGIKAGLHIAGPLSDPEEATPDYDRAGVKLLMRWVAARFPHAAHAPHLVETCFYTNTPDEGFVLERHGNIVVGSACSGHGFKFAPLIGERLADLAQEVD